MWYEPGSGMRFCETNQSAVFEQCIDTSSNCQYLSSTLQICKKPDAAKNLGCIKTCRLCNSMYNIIQFTRDFDSNTRVTILKLYPSCKIPYLYLKKNINGWSHVSDKCATGEHNCHRLADCKPTTEGFICTCKKGYEGDGVTSCTGVYLSFVHVIKTCISPYMSKTDTLFLNKFK